MASKKISWLSNGIICCKSGSSFYSFMTVSDGEENKVYSIKDCVPVKVNRRTAVMLAEIVCLWVDDIEDEDDDEGCAEKIKIRLYARPEDTPNGRNYSHGEDELLILHKHVVLPCKQFLAMEQKDIKWNCGVPLQPSCDHASFLPPSPTPSNKSSTSSITSLLYCHEKMVPVGLFEYEDHSGLYPCPSPISSREPVPLVSPRIRVVSFSAYCRYCAVRARLGGDAAYQYMDVPLVGVLGGIPVPNTATRLMYCKKTFRDINLERKLNFFNGVSAAMVLAGTKRHSTSSLSSSPSPTLSSSGNFSSASTLASKGSLPKRRKVRSQAFEESDSTLKKDVEEVKKIGAYKTGSSGTLSANRLTPRKRRGRPIKQISPQSKRAKEEKDDDDVFREEISDSKSPQKQVVQPATIIQEVPQEVAHPVLSLNPTVDGYSKIPVVNHSQNGKVKSFSLANGMLPNSILGATCTSKGSLADSETLLRSLRPRSSLLPPSQFRDDCYETQMGHGATTSSAESESETETHSSTCTSISTNTEEIKKSPHTPILVKTSNEYIQAPVCSVSSENPVGSLTNTSTIAPAVVATVSTAEVKPQTLPPVYKTLKSLTAVDNTQDVKELLKAHLSCLQATDSFSQAMTKHLESQLLDEKNFLDLLFCFMKLRKTPIHRVPRLGSRNLNLFELYKVTQTLGGYEQVTINRKWSYVFDSLGCAAGMTCASTVTRKHYEKLLLPFERALAAIKK